VPAGQTAPQASNFKAWTELLANFLAAGESNKHLRSYLKKMSDETIEHVNWLTHAKNAIRMDAQIGLKAVEHLLCVFTASRLRLGRDSNRHGAKTAAPIERPLGFASTAAGRTQPTNRQRQPRGADASRRAGCVPSSDISTFIRPEDIANPNFSR
jgi:hypothetical protein